MEKRSLCVLGNQQNVDSGGIDIIKVGQCRHSRVRRMDPAVELAAIETQNNRSSAARPIEQQKFNTLGFHIPLLFSRSDPLP